MGLFGGRAADEAQPTAAPTRYLVQTVSAVNTEGVMKKAEPFVADGWEVVAFLSPTQVGTFGMMLRRENPAYAATMRAVTLDSPID